MSNEVIEQCKQLISLAEKEDANLRTLSNQIASQNEILEEVLKKVNSIEFGLTAPVEDASHATAILGQRKLNEVLLSVINNHEKLNHDVSSHGKVGADEETGSA